MAERCRANYGCQSCENKAIRYLLRELKQWKVEEARRALAPTPALEASSLRRSDLTILHK